MTTLTPVQLWVVFSDATLHRRGRSPLGIDDSFVDYQTKPTKLNTGAYNLLDPNRTAVTGNSVLTVTEAGKMYVDTDFYVPSVKIQAANVKFINCTFHGEQWASGPATSANSTTIYDAIVDCRPTQCVNAYFERCTFKPDYPNWQYAGIIGHDYHAYRCQGLWLNDGFGVYRTQQYNVDTNVFIDCCYVDELAWFTGEQGIVHPSDTKTHNDCVQIQGGNRTKVWGNYLGGFLSTDPSVGTGDLPTATRPYNQSNSCVQMNANAGKTFATDFQYNWWDGGGQMLNGGPIVAVSGTEANGVPPDVLNKFEIISHNLVGAKGLYPGQELTISNSITYTATDNKYEADGSNCPVRTNG